MGTQIDDDVRDAVDQVMEDISGLLLGDDIKHDWLEVEGAERTGAMGGPFTHEFRVWVNFPSPGEVPVELKAYADGEVSEAVPATFAVEFDVEMQLDDVWGPDGTYYAVAWKFTLPDGRVYEKARPVPVEYLVHLPAFGSDYRIDDGVLMFRGVPDDEWGQVEWERIDEADARELARYFPHLAPMEFVKVDKTNQHAN